MSDANVQARIEVAVVSKAHGIKGEVVVVLHDPDSTSLGEAEKVWIGDRELAVLRARPVPPGAYLLLLEGISDRDVAAGLRGQKISLDREELHLDDDEILLTDLVGFQTRLPDGTAWGEIVGVELGRQDRLVIHHEGKERLLPVVDAFIAEIDVETRVVLITPPDGMPEEPIS